METATALPRFPSPNTTCFDAVRSTAADAAMHAASNDPSPPQYLKMEDLQGASSPSPASFADAHPSHTARAAASSSSQASPPPVIIQSKPAKKRKSWGQELPEPKTTLPPRKRAKTDDEKEQRRIERIKRNRAAAHNSRERKRQEAETLAVLLARANAELDAYRRLHGPLPSDVVLPEVQLCTEGESSTPAPSLVPSRGSFDAAASPASPADTVLGVHPAIKQEPSDLPTTIAPPAFEGVDAKPAALPHLDETQHSAAMLCDLQCPSSPRTSPASIPTTTITSSSPSSTCPANSWWTSLFATLLALQLRTCYRQILVAIWTLSPSTMERMIRASTIRSAAIRSRSTTSSTTTPSLSQSTTPLAQPRAATGVATREGAQTAHRRPSSATGLRTGSRLAARANTSSSFQSASGGKDGREGGERLGDDR